MANLESWATSSFTSNSDIVKLRGNKKSAFISVTESAYISGHQLYAVEISEDQRAIPDGSFHSILSASPRLR
jgi:hypothetical protein